MCNQVEVNVAMALNGTWPFPDVIHNLAIFRSLLFASHTSVDFFFLCPLMSVPQRGALKGLECAEHCSCCWEKMR